MRNIIHTAVFASFLVSGIYSSAHAIKINLGKIDDDIKNISHGATSTLHKIKKKAPVVAEAATLAIDVVEIGAVATNNVSVIKTLETAKIVVADVNTAVTTRDPLTAIAAIEHAVVAVDPRAAATVTVVNDLIVTGIALAESPEAHALAQLLQTAATAADQKKH